MIEFEIRITSSVSLSRSPLLESFQIILGVRELKFQLNKQGLAGRFPQGSMNEALTFNRSWVRIPILLRQIMSHTALIITGP